MELWNRLNHVPEVKVTSGFIYRVQIPIFKKIYFSSKLEAFLNLKLIQKISKADVPFNYPNGRKIKVIFYLKFSAFRGPESQTFRQICKNYWKCPKLKNQLWKPQTVITWDIIIFKLYLILFLEARLKTLLHQIRYELEKTTELIGMIEDGLEKAETVTSRKKDVQKEVNLEQYKKLRVAIVRKWVDTLKSDLEPGFSGNSRPQRAFHLWLNKKNNRLGNPGSFSRILKYSIRIRNILKISMPINVIISRLIS